MKRYAVNKKKSAKRFNREAKKIHKINKASASSFVKRGGIRL